MHFMHAALRASQQGPCLSNCEVEAIHLSDDPVPTVLQWFLQLRKELVHWRLYVDDQLSKNCRKV